MKCIVCDNVDGGYCEFCCVRDVPRHEHVSGGTALEIELIEESEGYELQITNADGVAFTFNVHLAALQLIPIGLEVANYFREGERLARQHVPPVTPADLDGYDLNDPKRITLEREI